MSGPAPRISVVLAIYNAKATIAKCLESLRDMNHSSFEIIAVDDGSDDGTLEILEQSPLVRVIRRDHGGPSRARNAGVAEARGGIVAFTDSDCIVDPDWLTELESCFTDICVAGAGGDQKSPGDDSEAGKRFQEFMKCIGFATGYIKTGARVVDVEHNPSCNSAYRRAAFLEVGGFDEGMWPGEDVELDIKLKRRGYRLIFNPRAVVAHYRPSSLAGFARMMRRYGASQWSLVWKYGLFRPLHFVPPALLVLLAAFAWLAVIFPAAWILLPVICVCMIIFFTARTLDVQKSLYFTGLLIITLFQWNWGFFMGFRYHPFPLEAERAGAESPSSVDSSGSERER